MSLEKETMDVITIIIALSGLILSIYNLWIDRSDKRPKLSVKLVEGLLETKRKRKEPSYDQGYIVEVINTGQPQVSIVDVRINFTQKKNSGVEADLKRIIPQGAITRRITNNKETWYHISQAQILDQHGVTISSGDNAYYWVSKEEIDYYFSHLKKLEIFIPDLIINMKASVRVALGKTYHSNNLLIYKIKKQTKENKL